MKFNIGQGKIRLENRVIDLAIFQVRPKTTDEDLEKHYDCFIEHTPEIRDYFEDKDAFNRVLKDAEKEKRPKLIARNPRYPFMLSIRKTLMPFDFLNPSERRLHDKYFIAGHLITQIPGKIKSKESEKPLDEKLREDIVERFKQYPGYEGIIEIPNDNTPSKTKSTTFHESLHYLIARYQAKTERDFVKKDLSRIENYGAEHIIHETFTNILTDKLLIHDPDALFETRWSFYSLSNEKFQGIRLLVGGSMAIATGLLLASSISRPYLLPVAFMPGRIRDYILKKYKNSKREEILKSVEYPKFKI